MAGNGGELQFYRFTDEQTAKLDTAELRDVELLSVGTWRDSSGQRVTFTRSDLQDMVEASNSLAEKIKPFFKLGHIEDDAQPLATGAPSLGWIRNLRVVKDKLVADIANVPRKIYDLIQAGAYRRISAEVARNWTDPTTKRTYGKVLWAAGLLGAQAPAISNLKDVLDLYGAAATDVDELLEVWVDLSGPHRPAGVIALAEPVTNGGIEMEQELRELKERITKLEDANASAARFNSSVRDVLGIGEKEDPVSAIRELVKQRDAAMEGVAKFAHEQFESKRDALIEKAKSEGKLLPVHEGALRAMVEGWRVSAEAGNSRLEFSVNDGKKDVKVAGTPLECLAAYVDALPKITRPLGNEQGRVKFSAGDDEEQEDTGDGFASTVRARMAPDALRFATAGLTAADGRKRQIPVEAESARRHAAVEKYMAENKVDYVTAYSRVHGL
jgi:hypothetical protein